MSAYQGHPAIVYVSGTRSSDRKMHWSWSWTRILIGLLIIKSLGNAREGEGDRSLHWKSRSFPYANRIETCSSWKWRWPRACCASRRQRHIRMSISRHGLCISQGIGTWPITEKRVSLAWTLDTPPPRIEKSLAWWRCYLRYEPRVNFYVFELVMHPWWIISRRRYREFHLFREHNSHHLVHVSFFFSVLNV